MDIKTDAVSDGRNFLFYRRLVYCLWLQTTILSYFTDNNLFNQLKLTSMLSNVYFTAMLLIPFMIQQALSTLCFRRSQILVSIGYASC